MEKRLKFYQIEEPEAPLKREVLPQFIGPLLPAEIDWREIVRKNAI